MGLRILAFAALAALCSGCAATAVHSTEDLQRQVADTERAFAKTMADRDHAAFASFVAEEAVFFSDEKVLRGRRAVAEAWAPLYAKPQAPFSWEPDQVQVLDSGSLALSSGPVRDAHGKLIARFTSIWRQEAPGVWRIVFDKGNPICDCEAAPKR